MRYRLIPTRGTNDRSIFVETDDEQQLLRAAESRSAELRKPVLVVRYPEDQHDVQRLYTVGRNPNERRVRVR